APHCATGPVPGTWGGCPNFGGVGGARRLGGSASGHHREDGTAMDRTAPSTPRRAELLAALSMAIDLGLGQPMEHMLRAALLSTRLADRLGLGSEERATIYYVSLVSWIGCHADSHEYAAIFGDDIAARAAHYDVEWTGLPYLRLLLRQVGSNRPAPER